MNVGLILECGKDGPDQKVCEHLIKTHLAPLLGTEVQLSSATMVNKQLLIEGCGPVAAQLLADGCERVIIVWDLYPAWGAKKQSPCRKKDCDNIRISLADAGVGSPHVYLVCIEAMLEAWLLTDGRALSTVLSTPPRPVAAKGDKKSHEHTDPKARLMQLFQEHKRPAYRDFKDAERIAQAMPDLSKIKRCPSFKRFVLKLTDKEI